MRTTFFRRFILIGSLAIFLGGVAFLTITGEPPHHHKSAHEACPNGVIGSEQTRVEGGTDGSVDTYHFYTCADGTEVNAND